MKFNLLSVSQLCDNDFDVYFSKEKCVITHEASKFFITGFRENNVYYVDFDNVSDDIVCMHDLLDNVNLWHRCLGHASIEWNI